MLYSLSSVFCTTDVDVSSYKLAMGIPISLAVLMTFILLTLMAAVLCHHKKRIRSKH